MKRCTCYIINKDDGVGFFFTIGNVVIVLVLSPDCGVDRVAGDNIGYRRRPALEDIARALWCSIERRGGVYEKVRDDIIAERRATNTIGIGNAEFGFIFVGYAIAVRIQLPNGVDDHIPEHDLGVVIPTAEDILITIDHDAGRP